MMDSEYTSRYQTAMLSTYYPVTFLDYIGYKDGSEQSHGLELLNMLHSGKVFAINTRKANGLILFKRYHAEFAGPGAAVGGDYDRDCLGALPIGNLSLLTPQSHDERQKAYLIRRQWIRLIKQITENPDPQSRVQKILDQFEQYFPTGLGADMVAQLPDMAFALLVGVLPQTVGVVRRLSDDNDTKI